MTLIKVDWDKKLIDDRDLYSLAKLSHFKTILGFTLKRSTNNNWHLMIVIKEDIDDKELILWQMFLGSDVKREKMNFLRWLNGAKMSEWNILFTCKVSKKLNLKDGV